MTDGERLTIGGCMCGAVRYEARGEPLVVVHCHCESCRRHTGAPMVTLVSFERDKVRYTSGAPKIHNSSPGVGRAFCGTCGTPLTWEGMTGGKTAIEFHIGTLDEPNAFTPVRHVFHEERLDWFDTADELPRYRKTTYDGDDAYLHGPSLKRRPE